MIIISKQEIVVQKVSSICFLSTIPFHLLRYKKGFANLEIPQRLRWGASIEAASTVSQLALALRQLDSAVNQEALRKPYGERNNPYLEATVTQEGDAGKS